MESKLAYKAYKSMESKLAYACYKDVEYDCTLCAEAPNLCPYCEGYNPSNSRELDDWIKPFFDNCCRMEKLK